MSARIIITINSQAQAGWSETYYTSDSDLPSANASAILLCKARGPLLANEYAFYAYRTTILGAIPSQSQLTVLSPDVAAAGSHLDNDLPVSAMLYQMQGGGKSVTRGLRGLPDEWTVWNEDVLHMVATADVTKPFNRFATVLRTLGAGWPSAVSAKKPGITIQQIASLSAGPFGQLIVGVNSTTGFTGQNTGPIVIGGLRGLAGKLNGTYGQTGFSVGSATTLNFKVQVSEGQIMSYVPGTATVRLSTPLSNFITANNITTNMRVNSHKVGRGFGSTRGRRSGKR